jgi:nucleoside-diphosphate-sugar epimerase
MNLVTGATGFLGGALVTELLRRGRPVRILARDGEKARRRFGEAVGVVCGDITDVSAVRQAVDGASTIYHLAGRLYHPRVPADLYHQTHVVGTRTLLEACLGQARLRCIVHVSTTGVHGVTGELPAAEDAPLAPTNPYEATKLAGELLALETCREQGLPVTVVRPGLVYGPGDLHLLGFFTAIDRGLFRVIDGGRSLLHPVYVDDVVAALLLCAELAPALGRQYNVASERPVTVRELAAAIARALDRKPPSGSIPLWLANLGADLFAATPGMRGERAPLTRSRVEFLTQSREYDIRRARSELGYAPRIELQEGLQRTAAWYRGQGYLNRSSRRKTLAPSTA